MHTNRSGRWFCSECQRDRRNNRERAKSLVGIARKYGMAVATEYKAKLATLAVAQRGPAKQIVYWAFQDYVLSHYGYRPTKEQTKRLTELNKVARKPIANHGWTCSHCGIQSNDPWFFDVDHITPRHKGGSNQVSNLRILCPNCHRRRHLSERQE